MLDTFNTAQDLTCGSIHPKLEQVGWVLWHCTFLLGVYTELRNLSPSPAHDLFVHKTITMNWVYENAEGIMVL